MSHQKTKMKSSLDKIVDSEENLQLCLQLQTLLLQTNYLKNILQFSNIFVSFSSISNIFPISIYYRNKVEWTKVNILILILLNSKLAHIPNGLDVGELQFTWENSKLLLKSNFLLEW